MHTKNHLAYIDSLRAIAAIYVVMHHAVFQYYYGILNGNKHIDDYHLSNFERTSVMFFYYGHFAVSLFIVVSGFSLILAVIKNGYLIKGGTMFFFKRRAIRILPPYYSAIILSVIFIKLFVENKTGTLWDISIPITWKDIIAHVLLIHDFSSFYLYKINYAFWSISVEFRIYLFFPLLVLIWRKFGSTITILVSVLISITGSLILLYLRQNHTIITSEDFGVSPYIVLFTLGMLSADISFSNNDVAKAVRQFFQKLNPINIIVITVAYLFIFIIIKNGEYLKVNNKYVQEIDLQGKVDDILLGIFFAFVLLICSISSKRNYNFWLVKILFWKPLIFIGTFSYSLYLIHAPLLAFINQFIILKFNLDGYSSSMLLLIIGTPIIILIAYGFFYLFERPFLTLGKKVSIEVETIINPAP